jgi:hypothetical protein
MLRRILTTRLLLGHLMCCERSISRAYCDVHAVDQQSQQKKDVAWQQTCTQQWADTAVEAFSLGPVLRQRQWEQWNIR